jgi:hypothetical protein
LLTSNEFSVAHTLAASRILRGIILRGDKPINFSVLNSFVQNYEGVDYLQVEMQEVQSAIDNGESPTDAVHRWVVMIMNYISRSFMSFE